MRQSASSMYHDFGKSITSWVPNENQICWKEGGSLECIVSNEKENFHNGKWSDFWAGWKQIEKREQKQRGESAFSRQNF